MLHIESLPVSVVKSFQHGMTPPWPGTATFLLGFRKCDSWQKIESHPSAFVLPWPALPLMLELAGPILLRGRWVSTYVLDTQAAEWCRGHYIGLKTAIQKVTTSNWRIQQGPLRCKRGRKLNRNGPRSPGTTMNDERYEKGKGN